MQAVIVDVLGDGLGVLLATSSTSQIFGRFVCKYLLKCASLISLMSEKI